MSNDLNEKLQKINENYNQKVIARGVNAKILDVPRFRTDVFDLDFALGGGVPRGRVLSVWGESSDGKTSTALKMVEAAQKTCRHCLNPIVFDEDKYMLEIVDKYWGSVFRPYELDEEEASEGELELSGAIKEAIEESDIDPDDEALFSADQKEGAETVIAELEGVSVEVEWVGRRVPVDCLGPENCDSDPMVACFFDVEGALDSKWAQALGVDMYDLYVLQTEYMEQGIDISDSMIRDGDIDLIVVDSIAAFTPIEEIEKSSEDNIVGTHAKKMNKACREWISSLCSKGLGTTNRATVVLLNQVREDVGTMWGNPRTKPGGKGQEFVTSIDLYMFSKDVVEGDDDGNKIVEYNFETKKNKTFRDGVKGSYQIATKSAEEYDKGELVDEISRVFNVARDFGLIKSPTDRPDGVGGWLWVPEDIEADTLGGLKDEVKEQCTLSDIKADAVKKRIEGV